MEKYVLDNQSLPLTQNQTRRGYIINIEYH